MTEGNDVGYVVFVVGGAVAGSEAVHQLTNRGVRCVVLEQNRRPYGKIEDGLPRWHVKLRASEARKIDDKLNHPLTHFVPNTKIGRDVSLDELRQLGPSAIVLANGAWRDRPLGVPGIEEYHGRGFLYQNELVAWFNHYTEPDYAGPAIDLPDGAVVIGGGLASLDVMKILQLETVAGALRKRDIGVDLYEMERYGIGKGLEELNLSMEELGLVGATLCYRRTVEDMPVTSDAGSVRKDPERLRLLRRRILDKCQARYLFHMRELVSPAGPLAEHGRLGGLVLTRTELRDGRVYPLQGSEHPIRAPLVVSSIGSIPEPIPGVSTKGELYAMADESTGEVEDLQGVFAMGNAVTGRGNIAESLKHGRKVSQEMIDKYLLGEASGYEESWAQVAAEAQQKAAALAGRVAATRPLAADRVGTILQVVRTWQARAGYSGDYKTWVGTI